MIPLPQKTSTQHVRKRGYLTRCWSRGARWDATCQRTFQADIQRSPPPRSRCWRVGRRTNDPRTVAASTENWQDTEIGCSSDLVPEVELPRPCRGRTSRRSCSRRSNRWASPTQTRNTRDDEFVDHAPPHQSTKRRRTSQELRTGKRRGPRGEHDARNLDRKEKTEAKRWARGKERRGRASLGRPWPVTGPVPSSSSRGLRCLPLLQQESHVCVW